MMSCCSYVLVLSFCSMLHITPPLTNSDPVYLEYTSQQCELCSISYQS